MGANSQEYNKSLAERLEEDHEKSYLGKKYDNLAKKTGPMGTIGGMVAPMAGGIVGNVGATLSGNQSFADYATMGGSAVGAAMAPIMFRGMQKQATKDIKDTNSRNVDLKKGGKVSGVQALDSMLNAGKSSKSAFMGGMAGGYGYGAFTGNMMDPATMMLAGKATSALSNPGSMAYLAASQMAGANYLGGSGNTHQAALLGSSVKGLGNAYNSFFGEKLSGPVPQGMDTLGNTSVIGDGLKNLGSGIHDMTGIGGSLTGMLTYMLASAGGNKLMKSIKSSAQAKDTKKYNYKVGDLGRPASTDRDVTKYDTMKSVAAQVNLLTVTGQLSPFESLALGYYQSMDKHLLFLNAIYDIMNEEENNKNDGKEELFNTHNKLSDLFNENMYDEHGFSTKDSYLKKENKGYIERSGDRISEVGSNVAEYFQNRATDLNAWTEMLNPLKVLTGGMLGNSSTKDIKALYGLDEDSKRENAISQTASDMNLPSSMIQLAEMDISQIMKMSDTVEGKQLAVQSFSAGLLQNMLKLKLDEKSTNETGKSFFNRTQENYDSQNHDSWFDKLKDSAVMGIGNIPGLNIASSLYMMNKGWKERKKAKEEVSDPNMVEGLALSDSAELKGDDFLSLQFPSLFLENISLDEERNQLLRQMLECWDCDLSKIKKKSFGVYDAINGQVSDEASVQSSFAKKFDKDSSSIHEQYKLAIENDPKNEKEYLAKRDEEIVGLKNTLSNQYQQSTLGNGGNGIISGSVADSQQHEKDEKYKSKMLEAFEAIADEHKAVTKTDTKSNIIDQAQDKMGSGWSQYKGLVSKYGVVLGTLFGAGKLAGNLTKLAFKSLFSFVVSHKKIGTALGAAMALGYIAYEFKDSSFIKGAVEKFGKVTSTLLPYFGDNEDGEVTTGSVLSAIGTGLMFLPIPGARLLGGILMLAGGAMTLDWDKIMNDFSEDFPKIAEFLHIGKFAKDINDVNSGNIAVNPGTNPDKDYAKRKQQIADSNAKYKLKQTDLLKVTDLKKELEYIKDDKIRKRAQGILDKLNKDGSDYIDKDDRKGREKEFDKLQKELSMLTEKSLSSNIMILRSMESSHEITKKEYQNFLKDNSLHNVHLRKLLAEQISASKYQITAHNPKYDKSIR